MARALMGHLGTDRDQVLALEIVRLRRRVSELEAEVTRLREAGAAGVDLPLDLDLHRDLELHRIAETAAPALA